MLVFAISEPLTRGCMAFLAVDHFIRQGYEVQVLDLTPLVRPSYSAGANEVQYPEYCQAIESFSQLKRWFAQLARDAVVMNQIGGEPLKIYRANRIMAKFGHISCHFYQGALPFKVAESSSSRLKRYLKLLTQPQSTLEKLCFKLLRRYAPIANDLAMVAGEATMALYANKIGKAGVIGVHSWDFDSYLQDQSEPDADGIVFIDSNYFKSQDEKLAGLDYSDFSASYLGKLNRFFTEVEARFNTTVTIATHPRVDVDERAKDFEGRKVIKGKTPALVKQAKLVFMNPSTAASFVVLNNTPAIYLTCTELQAHVSAPLIPNMAEAMKQPVMALEQPNLDEVERIMNTPPDYQDYLYQYIKTQGVADLPSYQILEQYLVQHHQLRKEQQL